MKYNNIKMNRDMKHIFNLRSVAIAAVLLATTTGCHKNEEFSVNSRQEKQVTLSAGINSTNTKVTYGTPNNGGIGLTWTGGDAFRLYNSSGGVAAKFTLSSGSGTNHGTFSGTATNDTYKALYPAPEDGNNKDWNDIKLSYENQIQDGNNSTAHLPKFTYMTAENIAIGGTGNQSITPVSFKHLGAVLQFDITMPPDYNPATDGQPLNLDIQTGKITNIITTAGTPPATGEESGRLSLQLTNFNLSGGKSTFTAYIMSPAFDITLTPEEISFGAMRMLQITLRCGKNENGVNISKKLYTFINVFENDKIYSAGYRYKFDNIGSTTYPLGAMEPWYLLKQGTIVYEMKTPQSVSTIKLIFDDYGQKERLEETQTVQGYVVREKTTLYMPDKVYGLNNDGTAYEKNREKYEAVHINFNGKPGYHGPLISNVTNQEYQETIAGKSCDVLKTTQNLTSYTTITIIGGWNRLAFKQSVEMFGTTMLDIAATSFSNDIPSNAFNVTGYTILPWPESIPVPSGFL